MFRSSQCRAVTRKHVHYEVGLLMIYKIYILTVSRALVFASGLVLGLEIFAKYPVESDINNAFEGAKDVLRHLATQSPQAAHYLDILTTLSGAIDKRRSNEASSGRSRYVSKLFSLDAPESS